PARPADLAFGLPDRDGGSGSPRAGGGAPPSRGKALRERASMILREVLGVSFDELRGRDLRPVRVAVLDSGVDSTHEDLLGRVTEAYHVEPDGDGWRVEKGV